MKVEQTYTGTNHSNKCIFRIYTGARCYPDNIFILKHNPFVFIEYKNSGEKRKAIYTKDQYWAKVGIIES